MDFQGRTADEDAPRGVPRRGPRSRAPLWAAVASGLLLAPLVFASSSSAQSADPAAEEQHELRDARDERERLSEELQTLRTSDEQLLAYIEGLEAQLVDLTGDAEEAQERSEWADHHAELAAARLEVARRVVELQRSAVNEHATATYVGPAPAHLGTRALGDDANETSRRVVLVGTVLGEHQAALSELEDAERRLEDEQAVADDVVAMAAEARRAANDAEAQLQQVRAEYIEARQRLQVRIGEVEAEIEELRQAELELERLIRRIQLDAIRNAGAAPDRLFWPAQGWVSSEFGPRWGRNHNGIDIAAVTGTEVVAAAGGTVSHAGPFGSFGNLVMIEHGGGVTTLYAHLDSIAVREGEEVEVGERIGAVGSTGRSTGPHLHFEVRRGGDAVDPRTMLL